MINDFVKKLLVIEDEESEKENLRKMDSVRELFDIARNTDDPVLHRRIRCQRGGRQLLER